MGLKYQWSGIGVIWWCEPKEKGINKDSAVKRWRRLYSRYYYKLAIWTQTRSLTFLNLRVVFSPHLQNGCNDTKFQSCKCKIYCFPDLVPNVVGSLVLYGIQIKLTLRFWAGCWPCLSSDSLLNLSLLFSLRRRQNSPGLSPHRWAC